MIAIPDSSNSAALGFAEEAGLPFELGLIRNHYVGPHLHPAGAAIARRRRAGEVQSRRRDPAGTSGSWRSTIRSCAARPAASSSDLLFRAGAPGGPLPRRLGPPITHPCYYGIDTPRKSGADRAAASTWRRSAVHRRDDPRLSHDGRPGRRACGRRTPTATPASPARYPTTVPERRIPSSSTSTDARAVRALRRPPLSPARSGGGCSSRSSP